MKYQEFIEKVKTHISSQLNSGQKIAIHQVTKNNGLVYDGLFIVDPVLNVSPTIYLNPYYHRYLNGVSLEDIYEDILTTYYTNLPKQDFDVSVFTDFSKAKERIVMKLVNRRRNEALLQNVPFVPYLDLAIVFVCTVTEYLDEYATILIYHYHLQLWNITPEELYQIAMQNTPRLLPYKFENMENLLKSMFPNQIPLFDNIQLYILTNQLKVHGAISLLYPNLLSNIADILDSNLIIIPSSIHEVLILPEKQAVEDHTIEDYNEMIREVNDTQLTDDEILGDHIYLYNKATGKIDD